MKVSNAQNIVEGWGYGEVSEEEWSYGEVSEEEWGYGGGAKLKCELGEEEELKQMLEILSYLSNLETY